MLDVIELASASATSAHARPVVERKAAGRILIVDDSPTTRAVLRNLFTAAGYVVSTATDGIDAWERLSSLVVDVVISDVEMPRLNGFDLARRIKQAGSNTLAGCGLDGHPHAGHGRHHRDGRDYEAVSCSDRRGQRHLEEA